MTGKSGYIRGRLEDLFRGRLVSDDHVDEQGDCEAETCDDDELRAPVSLSIAPDPLAHLPDISRELIHFRCDCYKLSFYAAYPLVGVLGCILKYSNLLA